MSRLESKDEHEETEAGRSGPAHASGDRAASTRCHAKDAGDPSEAVHEEEEITPEMISAGVYAFQTTLDLSDPLVFADEVVRSVYIAMAGAKFQQVACRSVAARGRS
jgi:hypothetical protein